MRMVFSLGLVLVLAGAVHAGGLRFRLVDAMSGKPIAGATVERWASQWQPRILLPPGRFWFPAGRHTTDADGYASLEKVARDDGYAISAKGYEEGSVTRGWFKYQFTARSGSTPQDLVEQAGVLVIPLKPSSMKSSK